MNKKNNLQGLIQGKCLATFEPTSQPSDIIEKKKTGVPETGSDAKPEKKQAKKIEKVEKKLDESAQISPITEPFAVGLKPGENEIALIKSLIGEQEVYAKIWDTKILRDGKLHSSFHLNDSLAFQYYLTACPLLVDLQPDYRLEHIVINMSSERPELFYCKSFSAIFPGQFFKVAFQFSANVKGIFRHRVILTLQKTGLFDVVEGDIFRVM